MFLGKEGPASKHSAGGEGATTPKGQGREGLIGMGLLVVNLLIDGATNSGQDEIFRRFKVSGEFGFPSQGARCVSEGRTRREL